MRRKTHALPKKPITENDFQNPYRGIELAPARAGPWRPPPERSRERREEHPTADVNG